MWEAWEEGGVGEEGEVGPEKRLWWGEWRVVLITWRDRLEPVTVVVVVSVGVGFSGRDCIVGSSSLFV